MTKTGKTASNPRETPVIRAQNAPFWTKFRANSPNFLAAEAAEWGFTREVVVGAARSFVATAGDRIPPLRKGGRGGWLAVQPGRPERPQRHTEGEAIFGRARLLPSRQCASPKNNRPAGPQFDPGQSFPNGTVSVIESTPAAPQERRPPNRTSSIVAISRIMGCRRTPRACTRTPCWDGGRRTSSRRVIQSVRRPPRSAARRAVAATGWS